MRLLVDLLRRKLLAISKSSSVFVNLVCEF